MNIAQKIAFNTTVQIAGRVVGVLVSLLTLRVTTAYLGVDAFGELAIIIAFGALIVTLFDLGVSTTLARELTKTPGEADRLAGSLLCFRVLSSLVLVLVTLAIVPALPYSAQTKLGLAIYLAGVLGFSLATFPVGFFQTHLQLHLLAAIGVISKVLSLVAVSVAAGFDLGFYALVGGLALVGLVEFAVAFSLLLRFWRPTLRWDRVLGMRLVRSAVAVGVVSMIGVLHFRGDAILLSLLAPARDVGIYAVAFQFISQAFLLPGLLMAAVFPVLTRRVHEGPGRADETINRTLQVLALGSLAVALAVVTLARPIVHVIAGEDFEDAVEPARILALCLPFIFCAPIFFNLCIAIDRQRPLIWVGLASVAVNVALNLVLIPAYSYNGAAVATVLSEGLAFLGSAWVAKRTVAFRLDFGALARIASAGGLSTLAAAVFLERSELFAFAASELTLLGVAYATRTFTISELRALLTREGRAEGA